jgi:hypothetical protein
MSTGEALRRRPVTDPRVLLFLRGRDVAARIATLLEQAWHELVPLDWPQLRAICVRDMI